MNKQIISFAGRDFEVKPGLSTKEFEKEQQRLEEQNKNRRNILLSFSKRKKK